MSKSGVKEFVKDTSYVTGYIGANMAVGIVGAILRNQLNNTLLGKVYKIGIYASSIGIGYKLGQITAESLAEFNEGAVDMVYDVKELVMKKYGFKEEVLNNE